MPAARRTGVDFRGPYWHEYLDGRPGCWKIERVDYDDRNAKGQPFVDRRYLNRAKYPTEASAAKYLATLQAEENDKKRVTWDEALRLYEFSRRTPRTHPKYAQRTRSLATTMAHLRTYLVELLDKSVGALKADRVKITYTGVVVPGPGGTPEVKEHGLKTRPTRLHLPDGLPRGQTARSARGASRWRSTASATSCRR